MSRVLPVWLLASALAALVGCGGGADSNSSTVADKGSEAQPSSTPAPSMGSGGASMPSGDSGMATTDSTMMNTPGGAEMDMAMYGSSGSAGTDPAAMTGADAAAMAEAYGAGAEDRSADAGTSPEDMAAAYGAGNERNYPGSDAAVAYPGGAEGGAYPGGEYPGGPGAGGVEEKVPEGYDGKAQLAFRRGKDKDAMHYLYAHALATDEGAESLLPTIRWVSGLREPRLAVRWGVGFVVTAPRNFGGDPKPVGSHQNIPGKGNAGGGGNEGYVGGGGGTEYGAGGGSGTEDGGGGSNSLLAKGAGELGEKLAAAYTERVAQGDFGEVLQQAIEQRGGSNQGDSGGAGEAGYAGPNSGGGAYGAKAGMERGGPGGGNVADAAAAATQVTQIMPGLSMLGIGTQKELIDRAREDGIDAVVIIDVKLRVNTSNGLVTNDSAIALLDAKTQKKLHTTKTFNNLNIQKARAEGKEDNVDQELAKLVEAIDANFKMTDLPAGLNADIAAKRVAVLAEEQHDNPLPVLTEIRMYHSKGLLDESQLFAAYEKILGVDFGRLLSTGTEEDKKKVLNEWLPKS